MTEQDPVNSVFPQAELRSPSEVMRLRRMGAFFPTRLSFMRILMRGLAEQAPTVRQTVWDMDGSGFGQAVLSIDYCGHTYSLVAFTNALDAGSRTDRVIAEAWDATFVLFDGIPSEADLKRNRDNAPKQEGGRFSDRELVLSRANKSVRFFEHTVDALARGVQPDAEMVQDIGYLMRTTAVYGNGKFGIADRSLVVNRPGVSGPFQIEMLTVWLIRHFSHALVEHVARMRLPSTAVPLARNLKRHLGIGNSTGLGMAPFLVNHPVLLNNWMMVRETALARARASGSIDVERARQLSLRVTRHLSEWNVPDDNQTAKIAQLRQDWAELNASNDWIDADLPWETFFQRSKVYGLECQELAVAFLIEQNGTLIDGLADCLGSDFSPRIDATVSCTALKAQIEEIAAWALEPDFEDKMQTAQFWYVSEEKLEPRLGGRFEEPGAELESPLDIARQIKNLYEGLGASVSVAEFLMAHPEHRNAVRRVQTLSKFPYAEIQDNLIAQDCLPIDMLRAKLSLFGASKFDPKSDRWTRITLYQGAPLADELGMEDADDWWLPCFVP